jgi:endonuclease/exonuclease/phosphatase family metal-dependent hydrolase
LPDPPPPDPAPSAWPATSTPPDDSPIFRQNLLPNFQDAFTAAGAGYGRTYHARWTQTRIDHILASPAFQVRSCYVGPDVGSAHRPVLAEIAWPH